ncbi:YIF1-domain-containing protein, partial [Ascodesmis nigricans]
TPPIHHPVPQRRVQVPIMKSPPPPPSTSSSPYDNPYISNAYPPGAGGAMGDGAPPNGGYGAFGGFQQAAGMGNFFGDPMTAQMGFNVARAALGGSTEAAEKNISRYLSSIKPFFSVTNLYVLRKLYILLVPWRHHPWSRLSTTRSTSHAESTQISTVYLPPREDLNSPDMYIPVMSFVTYILLSALIYGVSGIFHPELLGYTATSAMGAVMFELLGLKLGCYLLNIGNSQLLDLIAYSGYKFVGCTVSILVTSMMGKGWVSRGVFTYVFLANAFFLLRSLKYVLLPDQDGAHDSAANVYSTGPRQQRKRRTWFLFAYSYVVQLFFMLILTSGIG